MYFVHSYLHNSRATDSNLLAQALHWNVVHVTSRGAFLNFLSTIGMASHSQATSSSLWDQPCSDAHLAQISQWIADWREVAPFLGLTDVDERTILGYAPDSVPVQRMRMLRTWRQKQGTMATYTSLADAFRLCNKQALVDCLSELLAVEQIRGESGRLSHGRVI